MKANLFSLLAVMVTASPLAHAQLALNWNTLDGGGGTSSGGAFAVRGTIGQPDPGAVSGGPFVLTGGFWSVLGTVQTPGAPLLSITNTPGGVLVFWPQPAPGWILEHTTELSNGNTVWTAISMPYATNETRVIFTEPVPAGNRFYRLQKPGL